METGEGTWKKGSGEKPFSVSGARLYRGTYAARFHGFACLSRVTLCLLRVLRVFPCALLIYTIIYHIGTWNGRAVLRFCVLR